MFYLLFFEDCFPLYTIDYYGVLGVNATASQEQLKAAYVQLGILILNFVFKKRIYIFMDKCG